MKKDNGQTIYKYRFYIDSYFIDSVTIMASSLDEAYDKFRVALGEFTFNKIIEVIRIDIY